jgi:VanZ family protein
MKLWLRRWGPSVVIMILIFIASGTPGEELPNFGPFDFDVKKGGHMTGYAMLAASFLHALAGSSRITKMVLLFSIMFSGMYAMTDEFHQMFTPGRTPSLFDVGIDTVGASIGALLWTWSQSVRAARQRRGR